MPWLTDLDVALLNGGIGYWADPGWRGRGHGPMSGGPGGPPLRGIMIHHTAGGGANDWRVVRDGRAGLAGPLSQMTLERDGGVRLLAAGQSWHAGTGSHPRIGRNNGNTWCIGIEGVSRGVGNDWTAAQRREYPRVAAALCRHYGLPADAVIGHKEWTTRKIDPGDWDMNAFRAEVRRHLGGASPARPAPKKVKPVMISLPIYKGANQYFRLPAIVGAASALYGRAWVSVSAQGGVTGDVFFQRDTDRNDVPPTGAGPKWSANAQNGSRNWSPIPSGTEYLECFFTVGGPGFIVVEFEPK